MKKKLFVPFLIAAVILLLGSNAMAQINNPKDIIKNKGTDRANSRIDQGVDAGFDKLEQGVGNMFKKKKNSDDEVEEESGSGDDSRQQEEEDNEGESDDSGRKVPF